MAITEAFDHIDPVEHLKDVDPVVLHMASEVQDQLDHGFDSDLLRANPSVMLKLVGEAYERHPDDPTAREAYVSGAQVGMNFMREIWAAKNLAAIVPFDTLFEGEPMHRDDSVA